jgi:ubiquitin carboxyl-terminal hydrolase 8
MSKDILVKNKKDMYTVRGLSGLENLGNTCFMNAVIQALSATTPLTSYFHEKLFKEHLYTAICKLIADQIRKKNKLPIDAEVELKKEKIRYHFVNSLTFEWYKLMVTMWGLNCRVKPIGFKKIVGERNSMFSGTEQHDAQEFLNFILDRLHEETKTDAEIEPYDVDESVVKYSELRDRYEKLIANIELAEKKIVLMDALNKFKNKHIEKEIKLQYYTYWKNLYKDNHSIIMNIFAGVDFQETICGTCTNKTFVFSYYNMIIPPIVHMRRGDSTLERCLIEYTKEESLTGINKYRCDHCKDLKDAKKSIKLWYVPNRLIIALKRFSDGGKAKDSTFVKFPVKDFDISFALSPLIAKPKKYELYAVINHRGNINFGHYYSFTKNQINGKWYKFDDSTVSTIPDADVESAIVTDAAYILFYKLQNDEDVKLIDDGDDGDDGDGGDGGDDGCDSDDDIVEYGKFSGGSDGSNIYAEMS